MKMIRSLLLGLALLAFAAPLPSQAQFVVASCGTLPAVWAAGQNGRPFIYDINGNLCVNASVTVGGFHQESALAPITATTGAGGVSSSAFTAGKTVVVSNTGATNTAYCALGVTATLSGQPILPSSWFAFTSTAETVVSCITSTSTTTVNFSVGSGLPTGAGGGGGGGAGGSVTQGTSPWIVAGGGTAGTPGTAVLTVQGISAMTPFLTTTTLNAETTKVIGAVNQGTSPWVISGAVTGTFWQATQPVSGTFWQTTQPVSLASAPTTPVTGTFWQATQPVSGTFWQTTQPVSIASLPSGAVTNAGTFAVQAASTLAAETTKVIGTVNQGTSPWVISGSLTANQSVNLAQVAGATTPVGSGVMATAQRVALATDSPGIVTLGGATPANSVPVVPAGYTYAHISAATTTTVKSGAGVVHTITINNLGTVASVTTVYDNTAGSGTVIGIINTLAQQTSYIYDVAFATGLTIVTTGTVAPDITVSYR